ncbi:MAG: hypothetical protein A2X84_13165 [Desulfuromonadaceae bacterium GWC2_58_13]|nr:MAG: hypothetical protein A2X84_13165 [Desulfuromonadaceae bacterium GWC2_58_13]
MKSKLFRKALGCRPVLLAGALAMLLLTPLVASAELMRLAVVGVTNQTDEAEFGKLLIAQGIANLVAQELYDTGRYVPVEDSPEITSRVEELLARAAAVPGDDVAEVPQGELGADAVARVKIKKFSKSRMRGFMGPFTTAKVDIEIEVEVSVQELDQVPVVGMGVGTGATKSRGVLFQVREDKVHFDQTSVGMATQEAVRQAVAGLMKQIGEGT